MTAALTALEWIQTTTVEEIQEMLKPVGSLGGDDVAMKE